MTADPSPLGTIMRETLRSGAPDCARELIVRSALEPVTTGAVADARGAVLADPSFLKGYLRLGNVRACLT